MAEVGYTLGVHDVALQSAVAAEFGVWSAAEAGRRIGSRGHSPTAVVRRWAAQGRLLGVPVAGLEHYPGFTFGADSQPRPVIARLLRHRSGWDLVAWLMEVNPALGDRRPVDVLDDEPDAVVAALVGAAG